MSNTLKHSEITEQIIRAFYEVYNTLGYGFLEKVYENAMCIELSNMGLHIEKQKHLKVYYKKQEVGEYFADIKVEDSVIVELKSTVSLSEEHEAQLLNYLKASKIEVGLLLNFGKKPKFKRKVFSNEYKTGLI